MAGGNEPFLDPAVEPTDTEEEINKKKIGQFTRVLGAWWKAANFVQSKDTALFYQRLIKQAVKGPDALHKWPNHIQGIVVDARGVNDSRDNPDIAFEYVDGFTPPNMAKKGKPKPKPQLRTLETGGAPPGNQQAAKRPRPTDNGEQRSDEQEMDTEGNRSM